MREFIVKSKERASMLIRTLISPSLRFGLKNAAARLKSHLGRAFLWHWEFSRLSQRSENSPYTIFYAGRKAHRDMAKLLLTIEGDNEALDAKPYDANRTAIVSEMPIPGTLHVPVALRVVIPLERPLEEITAGFGDNLRRLLRKNLARYRMRQILDNAEIDLANQKMLQPYASARHGTAAAQIAPKEVRRLAQSAGRLDFVLMDDEVVGCNLGCGFSVAGKKYWSTIRFGYLEAVFSNPRRLSETNAVSFYLALEWAIRNGYDYYDMGTCLGRPEDDLLQWKKRWGGELNMIGHHDHFHVRLPRMGAAQFLWETPLFSAKGKSLTLHLGLPDRSSDEEFAIHYRKMNFAGLREINLHCARPPSKSLLERLHSAYKHQTSPPRVKIIAPSWTGSE